MPGTPCSYDRNGQFLGELTSNNSRVILKSDEICLSMKHAIVAIEDRRFYENSGVDLQGIGRALFQDIVERKAVQGGSTIAQQFVKTALAAQDQRTILQKLREAALAFHLSRKWSKDKILTEYLNSIYFGNGAYGIESAARTYFGVQHDGCGRGGRRCASELTPAEAALLAGVMSSPSMYDPVANPVAAQKRRDLVLQRDAPAGLPHAGRVPARDRGGSAGEDRHPPALRRHEQLARGLLRQLDRASRSPTATAPRTRVRGRPAHLHDARRRSCSRRPSSPSTRGSAPPAGPRRRSSRSTTRPARCGRWSAARTSRRSPFNLATQGQRQPGSAFKPFVLATAIQRGISPSSVWASKKLTVTVPGTNGKEKFAVNNYEDSYLGLGTPRVRDRALRQLRLRRRWA